VLLEDSFASGGLQVAHLCLKAGPQLGSIDDGSSVLMQHHQAGCGIVRGHVIHSGWAVYFACDGPGRT
jgi:hypothetical protein